MVRSVADRLLHGSLAEDDKELLSTALATLRSATNWLEGHALFEKAHAALDYGGRVQRVAFPGNCALHEHDGTYTQRCPVVLAHNRIGMSIGGIIEESSCSVCGEDPDDCHHIHGRDYDGVRCVRIIHKFRLDHIGFVENPDFPDARILEAPINPEDLRATLGEAFEPGMAVICGRCLKPCSGVYRPKFSE